MIKRCVICGEDFESGQPRAKYCGIVCRMDANRIRARWNKKLTLKKCKCVNCGKSYETRANNRKYCDDCQKLNNSKKLHPKPEKTKEKVIQPEGTVNCVGEVTKSCKYSTKCGCAHICSYIEIVGRSRKCPPSACDKYEPITDRKRQQAENRKRILTNAIKL